MSGNADVSDADIINYYAFTSMIAVPANLNSVYVDCFHILFYGLDCADLEGFPRGAIGSLVGDGQGGVGDSDGVVETGSDEGDS